MRLYLCIAVGETCSSLACSYARVEGGGGAGGAGGAFAPPTLDSSKWRLTGINSVAAYFEQMIGRFKKKALEFGFENPYCNPIPS